MILLIFKYYINSLLLYNKLPKTNILRQQTFIISCCFWESRTGGSFSARSGCVSQGCYHLKAWLGLGLKESSFTYCLWRTQLPIDGSLSSLPIDHPTEPLPCCSEQVTQRQQWRSHDASYLSLTGSIPALLSYSTGHIDLHWCTGGGKEELYKGTNTGREELLGATLEAGHHKHHP
jgi:hypothetical protein